MPRPLPQWATRCHKGRAAVLLPKHKDEVAPCQFQPITELRRSTSWPASCDEGLRSATVAHISNSKAHRHAPSNLSRCRCPSRSSFWWCSVFVLDPGTNLSTPGRRVGNPIRGFSFPAFWHSLRNKRASSASPLFQFGRTNRSQMGDSRHEQLRTPERFPGHKSNRNRNFNR